MEKNEKLIKNTFTAGNIRDAILFLQTCIENAFPEFHFRGLEITSLRTKDKTLEGKSWNHHFTVKRIENGDERFWEVICHRTNGGESIDKRVVLSYTELTIVNS